MFGSKFRKRKKEGDVLPVLIPVMNLLLLLLPFLLENAFLQKFATLDMQLPTISTAAATAGAAQDVQLTVIVRMDGVEVVRGSEAPQKVAYRTGWNVEVFKMLADVKKQRPGKRDVIMQVDPMVRYDVVVQVMDVCRSDGNLFPEIVYLDEVK